MPTEPPYGAAPDRYEQLSYRRTGRCGLLLPPISLGPVAQLRRRQADREPARHPAPRVRPRRDPLRPGQQLRAALRRRRAQLRHDLRAGLPALSRRARALVQGGLRHVAGPLRRVGVAQVRARVPRPVPGPDGRRLRRHLLLPPVRPRDAARGDHGRAGHGRAVGPRALCGHLVVLAGAHGRGRGDPRTTSARRC